MDDTTNQVVSDDTDLSTVADDTGVTEDVLYDDDGNPIEGDPPEDEDELDIDGHKVKLPKSVAERLNAERLMQADYTRKTQELAEARKAFEAERQSLSQADEQEMTARANLSLIKGQLKQYEQVNWQAAFDSDPFEAQKAFAQYQLLQGHQKNTEQFLEQTSRERTERQQQETAKRLQEGAAELARDIPGWSPDLSAKLQEYGAKAFNLTKDDFDQITDPRAVKLLYWAHKGHQAEEAAKKAQKLAKQQEVTPAATGGKKAAPPQGLDDRLSADEWVRRRNAQLRKRSGALS